MALLAVSGLEAVRAESQLAARIIPDLNLTLMPIPAGQFTMGSPSDEVGRSSNEDKLHPVTIPLSFWLARTEVTQNQWRAVMGTEIQEQIKRMLADPTLYHLGGGGAEGETMRDYYARQKDGAADLIFNAAGSAPMYFVNLSEAVEFCRKLTQRERAAGRLAERLEFRLPSEAEWEYACRAGTTTATYAGNLEIKGQYNAPVLDKIAWYGGNSSVGYRGKGRDTAWMPEKQYPGGISAQRDVATKSPNPWGLYDMIGNVWEWCDDGVWRGGSYSYEPPATCRAASRVTVKPTIRVSDAGFRVALCDVKPNHNLSVLPK